MTNLTITALGHINLNLIGQNLKDLASKNIAVTLDLTGIRFAKPQQTLHLALLIREFHTKSSCPLNILINENSNVTSYLGHIGFFRFINFDYGNKVGEAPGGASYVPIKKISKSDLEQQSFDSGETLQNLIQHEAESLTRVLLRSDKRNSTFQIIAYSIREAIRNALEHSESEHAYVCAQRWANGNSEIAIIDEGIGIYESLKKINDPTLQENNFLTQAIKPGFTRAAVLLEGNNVHDNSGYGLYVLSELAKNYGEFVLSSNNSMINLSSASSGIIPGPSSHIGTLVSITFQGYPYDASDMLKMIIEAGEEEAKAEGRLSSSSRSKSLVAN